MAMCKFCELCHQTTSTTTKITGSLLLVKQYCPSCLHTHEWASQPVVNDFAVGNILISAAILCSGALPQKILRFLEFLNCPVMSNNRFFVHEKKLLFPAISSIWKSQQSDLLQLLEALGEDVLLGGDAQCDSPGFCAKYASYTVMDLEHNVVLDIQLYK